MSEHDALILLCCVLACALRIAADRWYAWKCRADRWLLQYNAAELAVWRLKMLTSDDQNLVIGYRTPHSGIAWESTVEELTQ